MTYRQYARKGIHSLLSPVCGCVEYSGCVPPVSHVSLSSSQCLHNTHLRYKILIVLGQPRLLFVYVILRNAVTMFVQQFNSPISSTPGAFHLHMHYSVYLQYLCGTCDFHSYSICM